MVSSKKVISLPSLDPPGTTRLHMVAPFRPHKRLLNDKQYKRLFDLPALPTLPRILIPNKKKELKPPLMHYGWVANFPWMLEYAAQHDLTVYESPGFPDDEDGDDENGERDDSTREPQIIVDEHQTVSIALKHIALSFEKRYPPNMDTHGVVYEGGEIVISLYTNYDLHHAPSDTFVTTLQEKLELSDPPMWYIDASHFQWNYSLESPLD